MQYCGKSLAQRTGVLCVRFGTMYESGQIAALLSSLRRTVILSPVGDTPGTGG